MTFFAAGCSQNPANPVKPAKPVQQEQKVSKVKHTIYRATDKASQKLTPVEIEIDSSEKNPCLAVLKRLVEKAPKDETTFPKGLKVKGVTVKGNLATVDVSREFTSRRHNDYDNTMMIYAIVDTLTEFKDIKKVTFTVEGKKLEVLGQMDMSEPFTRDEVFIKKK